MKRYTDIEGPQFSVNSAKIDNGKLRLNLTTDKKMAMVEVEIDGKLVGDVVTAGFDKIVIDTGKIKAGKHKIKIGGYDKYLNCSEQNVELG